ncbi:MAG TPA: PQQ-dependent dehydrogenase, methanol/ethanol family, partial [Pseudomonas sp.]|nr:PQQ-dependent dehydrogenase, methanol/ethanol family [Pseudomonas sp.]
MILLFMTTTLYSRTCARQPQSERMVVMLAARTDRQNPALDACISSLGTGFCYHLRHPTGSKAKSSAAGKESRCWRELFRVGARAALPIIESPGQPDVAASFESTKGIATMKTRSHPGAPRPLALAVQCLALAGSLAMAGAVHAKPVSWEDIA